MSNSSSPHSRRSFSKQSRSSRSSRVTPARRLAFEVLEDIRIHRIFLDQAWNTASRKVSLPPAEKAFARLLATEVTSRKGSLDYLINRVLKSPDDINDDVRSALRISFAELFYLGKAPHIVSNEGVELVRSFAPKAVGVANFVLRRACELQNDFPFGDIQTDDEAAGLFYGFPTWLVSRLVDEFGRDAAFQFMKHSNCSAPLFFVINQAHANGPQTLKALVNQGVKLAPVPRLQQHECGLSCFVFASRSDVAHDLVSELLRKGSLVISDGAAQLVATKAVPSTYPERFLEIGAGRGTKSVLLQNVSLARFGKQMTLDMIDADETRTKERIVRLKQAEISQNEVFCQDARDLSQFGTETYDAIFIDAPCTGVGTLRRHADIRWRVTADEISSMAHTGFKLLCQAARLVKPGGALTYATCTVFKEENEEVIRAFLKSEQGSSFEVTYQRLIDDLFSSDESNPLFDAHFVCVLSKRVS